MNSTEQQKLMQAILILTDLCSSSDIERKEAEEEALRQRALFKLVYDRRADARRNVDLQLNKKGRLDEKSIEKIFTKKEILEMPKLKELSYRFKENDGIHEFRYRRNGIIKSFSSRNYAEAKRKALEFCRELDGLTGSAYVSKDVMFNEFAINFMENVKKHNVTEKTYHNDFNRMSNYILPKFRNMKVRSVTAQFIQKILNDIRAEGMNRTAEGVYYLLKMILDYAENTDVIRKNPIFAVKIPLHQRENGKALTLEQEKKFVERIKGHKYELHFLILLYTGCRPCELDSIKFLADGFVTFRNLKQKNGKIAYKNIPITPMLLPYVERIKQALPLAPNGSLSKVFSDLVPFEKMYSLRHTFATRCQTCGVPEEIVGRWLGHASTSLAGSVYTHLPDSFMLEQAKKVEY